MFCIIVIGSSVHNHVMCYVRRIRTFFYFRLHILYVKRTVFLPSCSSEQVRPAVSILRDAALVLVRRSLYCVCLIMS